MGLSERGIRLVNVRDTNIVSPGEIHQAVTFTESALFIILMNGAANIPVDQRHIRRVQHTAVDSVASGLLKD